MHGAVVRLRALHVRERAHGPAEALLEAELRERDLPRRFVHLEIGQRAVADPVGLDADAARLELRELFPAEGRIDQAARGEVLVVRERPRPVQVADRNEEDGGVPVLTQDGDRVEQVVAVGVVEGDQHGARRQRLSVHVVGEHVVERDRLVAEVGELRHLLVEERDRHRHAIVLNSR